MSPLKHAVACAGLLTSSLACNDTLGPSEGIDVAFRAVPASVLPGDSFHAILTIINSRADTLVLTSGDSCVATLTVKRGVARVFLAGSVFGCLAVVTPFRIPPGRQPRPPL